MNKRPVAVLNFRRYWRQWPLKNPTRLEAADERYRFSASDALHRCVPVQQVDGFSCRPFYYEHQ